MHQFSHINWLSSDISERRTIFLNAPDREELIEQLEQTNGGQTKPKDPLENLRTKTKEASEQIRNHKVSIWNRINNWGSAEPGRKEMIEKSITQMAEQRLEEALSEGDYGIMTKFKWGERKLLLLETKKAVLRDLRALLQSEQAELRNRRAKFDKWARHFGAASNPITLAELQNREYFTNLLNQEEQKLNRQIDSRTLPERFRGNEQTENMIREQLIELNVVDPDKLDSLFLEHFQGGTGLWDQAIGKIPNPALRNALWRAANRLRSNKERGYRLMQELSPDDNIGSMDDRLAKLKTKQPGFSVALNIGGKLLEARVLRMQGNSVILRDSKNSKRYIVLDTEAKKVACRDDFGAIRDHDMNDPSLLVLNPRR